MGAKGNQVYWVYSVVPRQGKDDLAQIGLAHLHPDGNGFDVALDALPLSAKLVMRRPNKKWVVRRPNKQQPRESEGRSLAQQVAAFEYATIEQCLIETGGLISAVMERLDIPRRTLNEKMVRLGIDRRRFRKSIELDTRAFLRQHAPDRMDKVIHEEQASTRQKTEKMNRRASARGPQAATISKPRSKIKRAHLRQKNIDDTHIRSAAVVRIMK